MRADAEIMPPGQVDPKLLHRLFYADHLFLFGTATIALINIFPVIFAQAQHLFPASWHNMRTPFAAIALFATMSLVLCEETQAEAWRWAGRAFGMLCAIASAAYFLAGISILPPAAARVLSDNHGSAIGKSMAFSAAVFLLLSLAIVFVSSKKHSHGRIADGITLLLSPVVLILVVGYLFGLAGVQGSSVAGLMPIPAIWCLALLTLVLLLRRAERGFLSILWGFGTGSRLARIVAPVLLVLPLVREISRAHLLKGGLIPAQYAGAVLTSIGTILGFTLLLFAARMINQMQLDIQGVNLRDELTGLRSAKGFYLLAEQAFRYSRRVQEPFGVLFVDMDNLKIINDRQGHSVGSVALVETAKLLTATFRETDVIGRVGGDEFVVAGQFKQIDLAIAVQRLRKALARKNQAIGQRFSISLSMGYTVTEDFAHDTLQSLVKKADEAMYEEKRAKKQQRAARMAQNQIAQQSEATH